MNRNIHHKSSSMDIQFPQPMIINSSSSFDANDNTKFSGLFQDTHKLQHHEHQYDQCMDTIIEEDEEERDRSRDVDKLVKTLLENYQKLPEKILEKLHDLEGIVDSALERNSEQQNLAYSSRGLKDSDTEERPRLDRFKIRTLNPVPVPVKDVKK